MTINESFLVALIVLNTLDIYTTLKILRQGGKEVNPVMSWLMGKMGVIPALLIPKILFLAATWFYLSDIPVMVMFGLVCFYVLLVLHNHGEMQP